MAKYSPIDERLPHLTHWERSQLEGLILAQRMGNRAEYETIKVAFLDHLRAELKRYFDWSIDFGEKLALKKKFLNITGMWDVIPHAELKAMVSEVERGVKRPIRDQVVSPWTSDGVEFVGRGVVEPWATEVFSVDLKLCEPFAGFLKQFEKTDGVTYLDYLSGSREKCLHPFSNAICFYKSLAPLVAAKSYVSTSADPLTKTIYISLSNADGRRRDLISICYELVLETAFLDFYANWPGSFEPYRLLRNMTIIALRFLADVVKWLEEESAHAPDLRWLDSYLPAETFLGNIDLYRLYLRNLRQVFMRSNLLKLAKLNRRIGLEEDNLVISF